MSFIDGSDPLLQPPANPAASPVQDQLPAYVPPAPGSLAAPGAGAAADLAQAGNPLAAAIQSTAKKIGIDPLDLATAISYETAGTFDPWKAGPRTQWGQHRGLIQWGEPQAKQYGVTRQSSVDEQMDAVGRYLVDRGVKPGMSLMDVYSAINAGGVGLNNRSDANNGGAPGTVADKVNFQMAGHRTLAGKFLGGQFEPTAGSPRVAAYTTSEGKRTLMMPVDHDPFSTGYRPVDRLLGLGGEERFQLFPERIVRSGFTAAGDAASGALQGYPGLRREDFTDAAPPSAGDTPAPGFGSPEWIGHALGLRQQTWQPNDEIVERAMDMANLAMTGGAASPMPKSGELSGFRVMGKTPPELHKAAADFLQGRVSPEEFLKRAAESGPSVQVKPYSEGTRFQMDVLRDIGGYTPEQLRQMTPEQTTAAYRQLRDSEAWGSELRTPEPAPRQDPASAPAPAQGEASVQAAAAAQAGPDGAPANVPAIAGGAGLDAGAGGGGGPAGAGGLAAAQAAAARSSAGATVPEGLPTKPLKIAGEYFVPAPLAEAQKLAADYAVRAGIDYKPPQTYQPVVPERAARIAEAFEQMPHAPDNPKVQAAYKAMVDETVAQMDEILRAGLRIEFIKPDMDDPYAASPRLAHKDVIENRHLWVFPTDIGFGSGGEGAAAAMKNNPLLAPTKFNIDGRELLANDVFRIVHDYFGHFKDGVGFRADGEEHAWRAHSAMYSPEARKAMTTETRGQNSWVNYGPHGTKNRTASSAETTYADQKIGLLPDWVMEEGRLDPAPSESVENGQGSTLFANKRPLIITSAAQKANARTLEALGKPIAGKQTVTAADRLDPELVATTPERVLKLAGEISGLKGVMKYMTPEERVNLRRDTAKKLVDLFESMPSSEEMAAVAFAGRAKRGWYRESAQALTDIFGISDAPRFAALLAALSPQNSVEMNLHNALKTWGNWVSAGRPTDKAEIVRIMGKSVMGSGGEPSVLDAWKNNSIRALQAIDPTELQLSGPKVNSFMLNLRDHVNEVTNDAWMANYANVDQGMLGGTRKRDDEHGVIKGKAPGYLAMSAAVRKAAEIATKKTGHPWTPAEIQETIWSWAKALYETSEKAGKTTTELLRAGGLTHEQINETPDFGRLFVNNIYGKLLEEAGYGKELEAARSNQRGASGDGGRGDARSAEGSGFAQDAFERHLKRAAGRLEDVRNDRVLNRAKPVDEAAVKEALDEQFEERAAKLEDNGMSRAEAEAQARADVYGDRHYVDGIEVRPVEHDPFSPSNNDADFFSNKRPLIVTAGAQAERMPTFYSGLFKAVSEAKVTNAPAQQWLGSIKNMPGVKQEELDWVGLPEWLSEQKGNVSKAAIEQFVRDKGVRIEEETEGGGVQINKASRYNQPEFTKLLDGVRDKDDAKIRLANDWDAHQIAMKIPELRQLQDSGGSWASVVANSLLTGNGRARFDHLQMDGPKENYRSVALTMPGQIGPYKPDSQHYTEEGGGTTIAWARMNDRVLQRQLSAEEKAAQQDRTSAERMINGVLDRQRKVALEIRATSEPLERARRDRIMADFTAKKVNGPETQRRLEEVVEFDDLKPLQAKLTKLRAEEDAIRAAMPKAPQADLKTLFLEEVQSKRHQDARDKGGYVDPRGIDKLGKEREPLIAELHALVRKTGNLGFDSPSEAVRELRSAGKASHYEWDTPEDAARADELASQIDRLDRSITATKGGVPDAPFKSTPAWSGLVLKRMIREAAEKGYDQIAWTPGEVQADRYSLAKHVDSLRIEKGDGGTYNLWADKDGATRAEETGLKPEELSSHVGKDIAKKAIDDLNAGDNARRRHPMVVIEGDDLKVGGHGMNEFYDKMLVNVANSIGKKYGAKVTTSDVTGEAKTPSYSVAVDAEGMRYAVRDGEAISPKYEHLDDLNEYMKKGQPEPKQKVWVLPITPELRDAAVGKGFSLFMKGVPVIRVDDDPFEKKAQNGR